MKRNKQNSIGNRMKRYEIVSKNCLVRRMPVILRLDGVAFHKFTRGFQKPFDYVLMKTMQMTMQYLCKNIQGCVFGYTQSDEITLILVDYKNINTSSWFDNEVQKMCSVAASMASMVFARCFVRNAYDALHSGCGAEQYKKYDDAITRGAYFDCRAFNVPKEDVCNCVLWRQQDATRNSIQALAQANFSHKELQNLSCDKLQEKLFSEKGINWNDLEVVKKRGTACIKKNVTLTNHKGEEVERSEWELDENMPILTQDRNYIEKLIFLDD